MEWKWRIILVLIVAGLIGGGVALLTRSEAPPEKGKMYAQGVDERRFADVEVERVPWAHDPNEHLLHPTQTEVHEGRIYVLDLGEYRIKSFTLDGRLVATIGRGRGQAPGELQTVMDFFVRDGRLWVLDGQERRVSIFRTDGTYVRQFRIETDGQPFRITPLGEHLFVKQVAPTELFLKVDTTGQVLRRFGDLMKQFDERNPLAFGGDLVATKDRIIFGARAASYLHYYNEGGNAVRIVRTIDALPYGGPDPVSEEGGTSFRPPEPPIEYRYYTVQGDTLKVYAPHLKEHRWILDYYALDGRYLESVELPDPVTNAYPYHGVVVTNQEATLSKYRIHRK